MPRMAPLRKMFSRPVSSGWKPVPTSSRLATRPVIVDAARGRLGDAAEDLQQRALARAVAADDADDLALLDLEGDVLQRPELLDLVALDDGAPAGHVPRLARQVAHASREHVAQRGVAFRLRGVVADEVALAEALDGDDDIGHVRFPGRLDQVGEALFHAAELAHAQPEEEHDHAPAEQEAGQVEPRPRRPGWPSGSRRSRRPSG